MRDPKDVSAKAISISSKIKDTARKGGLDTLALLKRYALERFLARMSASRHAGKFTLKGGMVMPLVTGNLARPTEDIDGSLDLPMSEDEVRAFVTEIGATELTEEDGMRYVTGAIDVMGIREGLLPGTRIVFDAELATLPRPTPVRVKLDLCYGDHLLPNPVRRRLPLSVQGVEPTEILCYHWATVFSEKVHAIYRHGAGNTRLKDFLDLISLARHIEFTGDDLTTALEGTFASWGGTLTTDPAGLSDAFASSRAQAWKAFRKSPAGRTADTDDFQEVVSEVRAFIDPVVEACLGRAPLEAVWSPGTGWSAMATCPVP